MAKHHTPYPFGKEAGPGKKVGVGPDDRSVARGTTPYSNPWHPKASNLTPAQTRAKLTHDYLYPPPTQYRT